MTLPLDSALDAPPRRWGLVSPEVVAKVTARPQGPWGLEPQDLRSRTPFLWGHPLTPRFGMPRSAAAIPLQQTRRSSEIICCSCVNKL
jgi:hypothetical protein